MNALKFCSKYAYEPNKLGYCGPENANKVLFDYCTGKKIPEKEIKDILIKFEGLYPYLEFIGKKFEKDPLSLETCKAYWLGKGIERISTKEYREMVKQKFNVDRMIPNNVLPSHNGHTIFLFPVVAQLQRNLTNIENCMIRLGKVESVSENTVTASVKGILEKKQKIKKGFCNPEVCDYVSIHWNMCVEVLNNNDKKSLEDDINRNLKLLRPILNN